MFLNTSFVLRFLISELTLKGIMCLIYFSSGIKTVKDSRPLNDKQYQQSQVRRILDFLR
jgi:hypothetical protein